MPKKTFKENISPAMNFISPESIAKVEEPQQAPEGYRLNPLYIETKSKRLQLLVKPSLHEKLKKRAQREGTSVNDIVNVILEDALSKE